MTIELITGNMFDSKAQTLVNAINCVGAAGSGIALAFRQKSPGWFDDYVKKCKAKTIVVGQVDVYKPIDETKQWVLNFPTKLEWRDPSRLDYISEGLKHFVANYEAMGITSIAWPAIGCGLGGLDWKKVEKLMVNHLNRCRISIEIYLPIEKK